MSKTGRKRQIEKHLKAMIPKAPLSDFIAIESIAVAGHLRHLPPSITVWQAITTQIRHVHTDYDLLLQDGYDKDSALHFVVDEMNEILVQWGCSRTLDTTEDPTLPS